MGMNRYLFQFGKINDPQDLLNDTLAITIIIISFKDQVLSAKESFSTYKSRSTLHRVSRGHKLPHYLALSASTPAK